MNFRDKCRALLLSAAALSVCSCGSYEFTLENVKGLELGHLHGSEYVDLFGKPRSINTETNVNGTFQRVTYYQVVDGFSGRCIRRLALEFRNAAFNAFASGSSCDEDRTSAKIDTASKLEKGTGKHDVLVAMGTPGGRAWCPSLLHDKERCEHAAEVWSWTTLPETHVLGSGALHSAVSVVSFDSQGKVSDVWTHESEQSL
jgi:hypothetical protein